jgi:citrate lyase subunit beta/citryl-CoA lyase
MIRRAAQSRADLVFMDLEDAVAPSAKVSARATAIKALRELDWGRKTRAVRVNDLTTPWCYEDIISVIEGAPEHIDVIIVPKVLSASDVLFADTLITQIERKLGLERRIGLEVLIEEAAAMVNVDTIAAASPRLETLIFGVGDYSASQGIDPSALTGMSGYPGDLWHYGRWKIASAARAAGIEAIDGPFPGIRDTAAYAEECRRGLALGFTGKWALHPAQIDPALAVFTPDADQVAKARQLVAAYRKAQAEGLGAIEVDGQMVDAAVVRMVQNLLRRAEIAGM